MEAWKISFHINPHPSIPSNPCVPFCILPWRAASLFVRDFENIEENSLTGQREKKGKPYGFSLPSEQVLPSYRRWSLFVFLYILRIPPMYFSMYFFTLLFFNIFFIIIIQNVHVYVSCVAKKLIKYCTISSIQFFCFEYIFTKKERNFEW